MSDYSVPSHGFTLLPDVLPSGQVEALIHALGTVAGAGRRGLLRHPAVAALAHSPALLDLLRPHLPNNPLAVRAIYFDKTPETNWLVPWHQDLTIAVQEKRDIPGFGPWSEKDGTPHVQPPDTLLQQMLTIRLHLDTADGTNGALRVLPGTHLAGRLGAADIQNLRLSIPEVLCAIPAGGAMLMRPLLLHASSRSTTPSHRRILHLEYTGTPLPPGLHWHYAA